MTNTQPNHQNLVDGLMQATADMARRQQVAPLHHPPLKEGQPLENLRIILRLQAGTGRRTPKQQYGFGRNVRDDVRLGTSSSRRSLEDDKEGR